MSEKEITEKYHIITRFIDNNQLGDAFALSFELLQKTDAPELRREFEKQKEIYRYLLEYSLKGVEDPERETVYNSVKKALYYIAERLKTAYVQKFLPDNVMVSRRNKLSVEVAAGETSIAAELKNLAENDVAEESQERKEIVNKLFLLIWLSDTIEEADFLMLKKYALLGNLYFYERSIIVSALAVSMLRFFDKRKLDALFEYVGAKQKEVRNRALVGIVLAFYYYEKRIFLYDDLKEALKKLKQNKKTAECVEHIIYQIVRTKETETLTKRLHEEVIPEMQKMQPKIQDKLRLDDILSEGANDEGNPDWEELFDDAPELFDKMADFSRLQMEGSDVFMSAFENFKNFVFFRSSSNWFVPFYSENSDIVNQVFGNMTDFDFDSFAKGLEKTAYMCNSDKYSFCLNIGMMPAEQRNLMTELFKHESMQSEEIVKEDKLLNKDSEDKRIITRYIQDLYRFYKLHPWKDFFFDIFETDLDIHNTKLFKLLLNDEQVLENVAEMYFKKKFYADASETFETLSFSGKKEAKRYEKIGFCYQKMKHWKKALDNYAKAEVIKGSSLWLSKKTAFCYKKLNNFEKAKEFYLLAEKEDENNMYIQANIGHCFLELGDYENALKRYFKVEYYAPDNKSVMRPLAWCSFIVGKFDKAEAYYKKLMKDKPTVYDCINYGHLLYVKGEIMDAFKQYERVLKISSMESLEASIRDDAAFFIKHGHSEKDIDLLIDYIKTSTL